MHFGFHFKQEPDASVSVRITTGCQFYDNHLRPLQAASHLGPFLAEMDPRLMASYWLWNDVSRPPMPTGQVISSRKAHLRVNL